MKKPDYRKKKRDFAKEQWIEDRARTRAQKYLSTKKGAKSNGNQKITLPGNQRVDLVDK